MVFTFFDVIFSIILVYFYDEADTIHFQFNQQSVGLKNLNKNTSQTLKKNANGHHQKSTFHWQG
jgi:hypothetical protein